MNTLHTATPFLFSNIMYVLTNQRPCGLQVGSSTSLDSLVRFSHTVFATAYICLQLQSKFLKGSSHSSFLSETLCLPHSELLGRESCWSWRRMLCCSCHSTCLTSILVFWNARCLQFPGPFPLWQELVRGSSEVWHAVLCWSARVYPWDHELWEGKTHIYTLYLLF